MHEHRLPPRFTRADAFLACCVAFALTRAGDLNLLFSDGKRLYCYHDKGGYNGLCWTHREAPFCQVSLRDEDWEADLREEKAPDQKGFVIASRKLTDGEDWHEFRPGSLVTR